jgi:hypothetical protein
MTLSSMITVPLGAYPSHDTWAVASGEILGASRVRVCVGLLSVESVRGLSKFLFDMGRSLEDATVRRMRCGWIPHEI